MVGVWQAFSNLGVGMSSNLSKFNKIVVYVLETSQKITLFLLYNAQPFQSYTHLWFTGLSIWLKV
jgi:hypothetical protein